VSRESNGRGWALTRLIDLHTGMRNDLALLRRAVAAITEDGQDVDSAVAAIANLSIKQPRWSLRTYCASFCGFVHEHHAVEDSALFPMLLERQGGQDAAFRGVIDKLRADHRTLAGHLDEVERALGALPGDAAASAAAAGAMQRLTEHLEAHLDFEEAQLAPALNALSAAVAEEDFPAPPPPEHFGISGTMRH
jgi:Hemerythrin HHE cation binding domain